mmetsp:Transcript_14894/g.17118  ORF Transcript_14894/g.17118 Transcript_14894/m.17118 type:complete len:222 (-) Transcript_14894:21-686(-)
MQTSTSTSVSKSGFCLVGSENLGHYRIVRYFLIPHQSSLGPWCRGNSETEVTYTFNHSKLHECTNTSNQKREKKRKTEMIRNNSKLYPYLYLRKPHTMMAWVYSFVGNGDSSPGNGNCTAYSRTSAPNEDNSVLCSQAFTKSTNLVEGDAAWMCFPISTARVKNSATSSKFFSVRPRVVRAGVPSRTPPGVIALLSPTILFLFAVMWQKSNNFSILEPVMP